MAQKTQFPACVMRLLTAYEGSALHSYMICMVRRVTVRSYQAILSRNFRFYMLPTYSYAQLVKLLHTALYSIQRFNGSQATRVYRRQIIPWLPFIDQFEMRKMLHTQLRQLLFQYPPRGHPMFRKETAVSHAWLARQSVLIFGKRGDTDKNRCKYYKR
jgi:hypothetical protein